MRTFLILIVVILLQSCICPVCEYQVHKVHTIKIIHRHYKKPRVKLITNYGTFEVYGNIDEWVQRGSRIEILYKKGIATYIITQDSKRYVILE
jgi:hypothetical protein